jgi:hypothetical protein
VKATSATTRRLRAALREAVAAGEERAAQLKRRDRQVGRLSTALAAWANTPVATAPHTGPPRFIQLVTRQAGMGYSVMIALDEAGGVWERHLVVDRTTKKVTDEWWEAWTVERRAHVPVESG